MRRKSRGIFAPKLILQIIKKLVILMSQMKYFEKIIS